MVCNSLALYPLHTQKMEGGFFIKCQPAHQLVHTFSHITATFIRQFEAQYLAQGHFHMKTGGPKD